MGKKFLDFIVIGAPRCGTTTLFELAKQHPEVYLPDGKEVPFFNTKDYSKGMDWYLETNFNKPNRGNVLGTITPQYVYYYEGISQEETATRIYKQNNNTKIVVILRNPIDRAFSHYKMSVRWGNINDEFDEAVNKILNSDIEKHRKNFDKKNMFLMASEYARAIKPYIRVFGSSNVKILFFEELEQNPKKTIRKLFEFIGVDSSFKPEGLGTVYYKGGDTAKIKYLNPNYLSNFKIVSRIWRTMVPHKLRKKAELALYRWNIKSDDKKVGRDSDVYKKLVEFFRSDVKELGKLTESSIPWTDW